MAETKKSMWEMKIVRRPSWIRFVKLDPRNMMGNPVMFVVEVGSVITTILLIATRAAGEADSVSICRSRCGCGSRCCSPTSPKPWRKAAARLRPTPCARPSRETIANRLLDEMGRSKRLPARRLRSGDVCWSPRASYIPAMAKSLRECFGDESAITGESAPVIREAGGDRSAVTGGTRVLCPIGLR